MRKSYLFLFVLLLDGVVGHSVPEMAGQLAPAEKAAIEHLDALGSRIRRAELVFKTKGRKNTHVCVSYQVRYTDPGGKRKTGRVFMAAGSEKDADEVHV